MVLFFDYVCAFYGLKPSE